MTRNLRQYFGFFTTSFKSLLRTPTAWVIGFIFPIIFILLFGFISNNTIIKVNVGLLKDDSSVYTTLKDSLQGAKIFNIVEAQNYDELEKKLQNADLDGIVRIENDSQITLVSNANKPENVSAIKESLDKINNELTFSKYKISQRVYSINSSQINSRQSRYIDFVMPGIIGYALMSAAIFGVAYSFLTLRKENVLKRLFAAPTNTTAFILGQSTSRLLFILIQNIALVLTSILLFNFNARNGLAGFSQMFVVIIIGLLVFLSFGYVIAGIAKSDDTVAPIANLIVIPQLILGGTFFPVSSLPEWLAFIAKLMPVYSFNEAVRKITVDGFNLIDYPVFSNVIYLIMWGVVGYFAASKVFKIR